VLVVERSNSGARVGAPSHADDDRIAASVLFVVAQAGVFARNQCPAAPGLGRKTQAVRQKGCSARAQVKARADRAKSGKAAERKTGGRCLQFQDAHRESAKQTATGH
jgi:hypothetical protein